MLYLCSQNAEIISIHALRVEGDQYLFYIQEDFSIFLSTPSGWRATYGGDIVAQTVPISIHALRVEGDKLILKWVAPIFVFLSTPSGWRATRKK